METVLVTGTASDYWNGVGRSIQLSANISIKLFLMPAERYSYEVVDTSSAALVVYHVAR